MTEKQKNTLITFLVAIVGGTSVYVLNSIVNMPKDFFLKNSIGIAGFHAIHQVPLSGNLNLVPLVSSNKPQTSFETSDSNSPNDGTTKNSERGIFVWLFKNERNKEIGEVRFRDLNNESIVNSGYTSSYDILNPNVSQKPSTRLKDDNMTLEITDITVCSGDVRMIILEREAVSGHSIKKAAGEMEDNINDRDKETFPLVYGADSLILGNLNILTNMGLFWRCFWVALSAVIFVIILYLFFTRIPSLIRSAIH